MRLVRFPSSRRLPGSPHSPPNSDDIGGVAMNSRKLPPCSPPVPSGEYSRLLLPCAIRLSTPSSGGHRVDLPQGASPQDSLAADGSRHSGAAQLIGNKTNWTSSMARRSALMLFRNDHYMRQ
jgi:hypothetical protein